MSDMRTKFDLLYPEKSEQVYRELVDILRVFKDKHPALQEKREPFFSEKDVVLITYPDHVFGEDEKTLQSMKRFLSDKDVSANKVHILPFSPYSSDDGFSVIDHYSVKDEFGSWREIEELSQDFGLMFDLVINHVSVKHRWFQGFLKGEKEYEDFFISYDEIPETSSVFRPRTHPLMTRFDTAQGKRYVWTTFSADQVDLNFKNPAVLLEMIKILLFYIEKGARVIRLDAIAYVWKELGTSCIHLPQAHEIVRLFRDIIEEAAPSVWLITETNVPHKDNISYFGSGKDEAHLVYNFSLPPLLLYSYINEDSSYLARWVRSLETPSGETAFFNFTASHDGIGLTPLHNIMPGDEIKKIASRAESKGGYVNYRTSGEEKIPYELNIVYLDALPSVEAFLSSQAFALSLKGVPAIYLNSLIGARNWTEGVKKLGYNRAINRQKFDYPKLLEKLEEHGSENSIIFREYNNMLSSRRKERAFSPEASQVTLDLGEDILCLIRYDEEEKIYCIFNMSSGKKVLEGKHMAQKIGKKEVFDILTGLKHDVSQGIEIKGHGFLWLKPV